MVHRDKAIDPSREAVAEAQRDLDKIVNLASGVGDELHNANIDTASGMLHNIIEILEESDHDDFVAMNDSAIEAAIHIEDEEYALALEDAIEIKDTANELLGELEVES